MPKVLPVIIRGVVEEPGTYEGKAEIVPIGQPQFEEKQIDLRLEAIAGPSSNTETEASPWEGVARATYVPSVLLACFALGIVVILVGALRKPIPENQRSWLDYGNFYIVTWGIVAVIIGFLGVLLFVDRFGDIAQALGFLTAFLGAVVGLVGTFFGIKTSSDATAEAHRSQREAASGADTTRPQVRLTDPLDMANDVPPDIHPTATFSKDMDPATISPNTFMLRVQGISNRVEPLPLDGVLYDEATRTATFVPAEPLQNGASYEATIAAIVKDEAGNTLTQDHTWHFQVVP